MPRWGAGGRGVAGPSVGRVHEGWWGDLGREGVLVVEVPGGFPLFAKSCYL